MTRQRPDRTPEDASPPALRIALLGTRGAPARYGGFETAVEEIGAGLSQLGHDVVVYCRGDSHGSDRYRGMQRITLPAIHRKALETITHTGLSTLHALRHRPDVAVMFNAANAPYVTVLRAAGIRTALHIDGHDARREKWRGAGQRYYSVATRWGAAVATRTIVDSQAIASELHLSHRIGTTFVPYGARQPVADVADMAHKLAALGLLPGGFHLVVARFEPENKVLDILRGFIASAAELPLVVVGFEGYPGDYARQIHDLARGDKRLRLVGPVWDQALLDALYGGAASYLHGHSVGGTNPSLLRAMAGQAPVLAYDCAYNRETTGGAAMWFQDGGDVAPLVELIETDPEQVASLVELALKRTAKHYVWADVVSDYERMLIEMTREPRRSWWRRAQPARVEPELS